MMIDEMLIDSQTMRIIPSATTHRVKWVKYLLKNKFLKGNQIF